MTDKSTNSFTYECLNPDPKLWRVIDYYAYCLSVTVWAPEIITVLKQLNHLVKGLVGLWLMKHFLGEDI